MYDPASAALSIFKMLYVATDLSWLSRVLGKTISECSGGLTPRPFDLRHGKKKVNAIPFL